MLSRNATLIAIAVATACGYHMPPVEVQGPENAVAVLAGEWSGSYWSVESGRSGSIQFSLEAGQDTAFGDVLMVPEEPARTQERLADRPMSERIPIAFVRIDRDRVVGTLAPYRDPECGCRLRTTFSGTVQGDTLRGTFSSRHIEGGRTTTGQWRAVRISGRSAGVGTFPTARAGSCRQTRLGVAATFVSQDDKPGE